MPRPHRLQVAGGLYHVTTRGNRRQAIYHDDEDRRFFLALRTHVLRRFDWREHAYCLMTNHVHLLFETPEPDLSIGMHRLNWIYACYFNERHGFEGHLFEKRFWSRLVESDDDLVGVLQYIAYNPVRESLCAHPRDWRWSSFYRQASSIAFLD